MASTNKTTNYDLSQYIGTDKPTYLTDYNQDMVKIDTGIHSAKTQADTNSSAIGTLSNLNTETKTDIVSAMNEVVSDVATNTGNIAINTSNISTNTTHIGTLANLTTSAKADLVQSSNEINAKVGNIANLDTYVKSSTVGAINELYSELQKFNLSTFKEYTVNSSSSDQTITSGVSINNESLTVARNSDGSIFKLYGYLTVTTNFGSASPVTLTLKNTGITPTSAFTVKAGGMMNYQLIAGQTDTSNVNFYDQSFNVKANGDIEIIFWLPAGNGTKGTVKLFPCLYFAKDFGDTPSN